MDGRTDGMINPWIKGQMDRGMERWIKRDQQSESESNYFKNSEKKVVLMDWGCEGRVYRRKDMINIFFNKEIRY